MRHLDICSGIGGFSLGLERAGFETVAFCENDEDACKVLRKHWDLPIYSDIKELSNERLQADGITGISILTAGIPCQPYSVAGNQKGSEDDRALWGEAFRLIREIQPTWVIIENVSGFISMELDTVLSDLEDSGYQWGAYVIPACAVNANHQRDRIWVVANTGHTELSGWDKV